MTGGKNDSLGSPIENILHQGHTGPSALSKITFLIRNTNTKKSGLRNNYLPNYPFQFPMTTKPDYTSRIFNPSKLNMPPKVGILFPRWNKKVES